MNDPLLKQLCKYNSVSTDIADYDPSPLSPNSKLMYNQWKKDPNDELLINGFFRTCNIISSPLSSDIARIIASYYLKKTSKPKLKDKIKKNQQYFERINRFKRKQLLQRILLIIFFFLTMTIMFAPDIASIIISTQNNCNSSIPNKSKYPNLEINNYLFIGAVSHISAIIAVLLIIFTIGPAENTRCVHRFRKELTAMVYTIIAMICLFFIGWSILGAVLYSKMLRNNDENIRCSDMVLSWIILKFLLYGVVLFYGMYVLGLRYDNFCICLTSVMLFGFVFVPNIAAFVVVSVNDCNESVSGIYEYMMIGCSVHSLYIFLLVLGIVKVIHYERKTGYLHPRSSVINSGVVGSLFFIGWCIAGCVLYSKMDQSTATNKQCADVVISWLVLKFVECACFQPLFLMYFFENYMYLL